MSYTIIMKKTSVEEPISKHFVPESVKYVLNGKVWSLNLLFVRIFEKLFGLKNF